MRSFTYQNPTRLIFGHGAHAKIGALTAGCSNRVLFHYGSESIVRSGVYDTVVKSFAQAGVCFVPLGGVRPNPRVELVREGIRLCREEKLSFIVAVGGGSVIDSAKAIAMGTPYPGDIWELFTSRRPIEYALPLSAVLSLPASGSESSNVTVISNEATGQKVGYKSALLRPVFSIIDPALFVTLPKNQISYGVCDMMAHIFERYFSNTPDTDLIDGMSESVLRTIRHFAPRLMEDSSDENAWSQISLAGNFAHNGLLGLGRVEDWACHGIEHELSALYDIPHGAGLAILFPAWMRYIYREKLPVFRRFAVNVMGIDLALGDDEKTAAAGITALEAFFVSLELPLRLKDVGIGNGRLEEIARRAAAYRSPQPLGQFRTLSESDILAILQLAQ